MSQAKPQSSTKPKSVRRPHRIEATVPEASRLAAVILEVLAGGRTPQDAATAIGITVPRYYQLETRALNGLVAALQPRPKGKQPSNEGRIKRLERALDQARQEASRQQALVRATQRSLGIKTAPIVDGKTPEKDRRGRRKRRPTVRALKVAKTLRASSRTAEEDLLQQSSAGPPSTAVGSTDMPAGGVPISVVQGAL